MFKLLIYFFIGISLSLDAFSLSITIGTLSPSKRKQIELIGIIGLFHLMMPILGYILGNKLFQISNQYTNILVSFIFIILAIEMYLDRNEKHQLLILSFIKIIMIAITVSIDSFAVGIAFGLKQEMVMLAIPIISSCSMIFTYLGLKIGKYLKSKYQEKGKLIGIIILFLLGLKNLFFS